VLANAVATVVCARRLEPALRGTVEASLAYGDVGRSMPELWIAHGRRCTNLSGLLDADQTVALALEEVAGLQPEAPILIVAAPRPAS